MGPFIGKWLRLLEKHIPMVQAGGAGSTGIQLAKRVLADQVVMYVPPSSRSIYLRLIWQGTTGTNDVCWKYGFDGR
jgi:hypothetical protein